jgi:recombinational DNA repair protein (RecF pathway)
MSIEKYTTSCIVIESFDQGEHDRVYKLFTREFGLILVHAKSVRKLESKLRAHIIPRGVSLVTVVKGREVWRLVGAEEKFSDSIFIHDITQIIRRFIRGEGTHKALYDRIVSFLNKSVNYDEKKSRLLLYYIFLVELGYADAKIIGAKDIKEYIKWSIDDLYMHLLLSYDNVRKHVGEVMKEIQL